MRMLRTAVTLSIAVVAAVALTGCLPSADAPTPAPSSSTGSTRTATATPSATPTPSPTADIVPFSASCESLVSADTMYSFDPNFALIGAFDPAPGSLAAEAVAAGGTVCRWVHTTSSITVDVAVADLPTDVAAARIASLEASGTAVGDYGSNGFFGVTGGVGAAQAFPGHYWVTIASPIFSAPADTATLMSALTALR